MYNAGAMWMCTVSMVCMRYLCTELDAVDWIQSARVRTYAHTHGRYRTRGAAGAPILRRRDEGQLRRYPDPSSHSHNHRSETPPPSPCRERRHLPFYIHLSAASAASRRRENHGRISSGVQRPASNRHTARSAVVRCRVRGPGLGGGRLASDVRPCVETRPYILCIHAECPRERHSVTGERECLGTNPPRARAQTMTSGLKHTSTS